MSTLFPVISSNADAAVKYRATFRNFDGAALTNQAIPGTRFAYDGNRYVILSAITNGTIFNAGLYPIITGTSMGTVTNASGLGDTGVVGSRKLTVTFDGGGNRPNINTMFAGTISFYSFGVKFCTAKTDGSIIAAGSGYSLFLPDGTWSSTINYATGAVTIYTTSDLSWAAGDLTVSFTSDTVDSDTYLSVTGTAPLNLSAFFKNAPYSYFKENHELIIGASAGEDTTIAYATVRN